MQCFLDRSLQAVFMDSADVKQCVGIAVWFRGIVPAQYKLFFYDSGFYDHLEVTQQTTELEIIKAMG